MKKSLLILILCFITCVTATYSQQEKIYSYNSNILINKDASMIVTETIKVKALGKDIRRGIYRDFPTTYRDDLGSSIVVVMEILGLRRQIWTDLLKKP